MTPSEDNQPAPASPEPGHTGPQGEGGGAMSGRGQEAPGEPRDGDSAPPQAQAQHTRPPPSGPSGLATGLQPGGMQPGGGPGATQGSLGTGGGSSGDRDTGSLKRDGV